jgi:hypothetical protein
VGCSVGWQQGDVARRRRFIKINVVGDIRTLTRVQSISHSSLMLSRLQTVRA